MNSFQTSLYDNLNKLVQTNEAFFKSEFVVDGLLYQIFNYRLASYTDFLLPSALECRGVMFCVDNETINLVSLPMAKCFNLLENPFTTDLDLSTIESIEVKSDGSLISTYRHKGQLKLKSKGSLSSEQAIDAMQWLDSNPEYKQALYDATINGYTVNLEWCSLKNRIVLSYDKPQLIMLNVRDNVTGVSYYVNDLEKLATVIDHNKTSFNTPVDTDIEDKQQFVLDIPEMQGNIEGFIIRLKDGTIFKRKTTKYVTLHRVLDDIGNPRRLFEAVLDEAVDDFRSLFASDPVRIKQIDEMQLKADHIYNHMVKTVDQYYTDNKDLDRKSYAIKGKEELDPLYFSLAMNLYIGRSNNYKQYCKDKWKHFGLKDEPIDL